MDTKSNAPIDITANAAEVVNSKCLAIWRGAAEALQGTSRLRAETITVYSRPKGAEDERTAGLRRHRPHRGRWPSLLCHAEQIAHGDHAVYSPADDRIVITGDVVVVQGNDVARGDKLTIKVSTREAKMESGPPGRVSPAACEACSIRTSRGQNAGPAKP